MGRPVGVAFVMNMSQWQATGTGYALTAAIPASSRNNLSAGYSARRSSVTTMRVDFKNSDGPYDTPRDARGRPRPPSIAGWQRQRGRRVFPQKSFRHLPPAEEIYEVRAGAHVRGVNGYLRVRTPPYLLARWHAAGRQWRATDWKFSVKLSAGKYFFYKKNS